MLVGVDEARHERTALEVDDRRRSRLEAHDGVGGADRCDLAVLDREGLDRAAVAGHRNDRAAAEDEIRAVRGRSEGGQTVRKRQRAGSGGEKLSPRDPGSHVPDRSENISNASPAHRVAPQTWKMSVATLDESNRKICEKAGEQRHAW